MNLEDIILNEISQTQKGKYYNCPVYEMLGGRCRDKIRMYTHIKRTAAEGEFSVDDMISIADRRLAEGYTALKYSIIPPIRQVDQWLRVGCGLFARRQRGTANCRTTEGNDRGVHGQ